MNNPTIPPCAIESAMAPAVALGNSVYIWNANTASVAELANLGDLNQVTSVAWAQNRRSHLLSVGTLDG